MDEAPRRIAVPSAEELVCQHAELVQRLAFRLCNSAEEAREAAQETFLNLLEALPGFRAQCAISTWIYRITVNTCRGRGRRRQIRRTREAPLDQEPVDDRPSSQDRLEHEERRAAVRREIDRLPEDYRTVVVLHYLQRLKYEEIAAVLEIPLGTVKIRLFRAKRLLRSSLSPD
ncbi:MAG: RNA polymerase sigma factor [Candidatus Latescibacterota bacterium]